MPKWTDYTTKTTVADNDEVMALDTAGKANKRLSLSTLSDWVLGKIADKVFEKLQTNDKTILGAINELNSNILVEKDTNVQNWNDVSIPGIYSGANSKNAPVANYIWINAICLRSNHNNRFLHIIAFTSDNIFIRRMDNGIWGNWAALK